MSQVNPKQSNNPSDPWSFNPLNPVRTPSTDFDPLRKHRQRTDIPDRADIYAVQADIHKGLMRLGEVEIDDDATRAEVERALVPIRSGYKILVRYLQQHGGTQENPGGLA